ncbi:MAG TPA: carboxypeptidase-like regulatory domain-containing protein, partial [Acidobacteriaceae bacterium]
MKQHFGRPFIAFCFILFTAFAAIGVASAQQTLGTLNGTVLDISGAAVPNATVTVTDPDIGVTRTTTASKSGFYQVFNLPPGTYKISATHAGFQTTDVVGISVTEAQATTANIKLKVGQVSEAVEVEANPLLNATDATNGYTLSTGQIQMTPLATGSFTQLAVLAPGVNAELLSGLDSNAGLGNQPIWANGQRDTSNTFQVNGVDATNLFNGKSSSGSNSQRYNFNIGGGSTSASSSAGAATIGGANPVGTSVYGSNGNSLPSPPPEFLQELRVNTSMYDAQQGATSGAQIDASTISGTNQFHGQIYGSLANNFLNADPYFFKQEALLSQQGVGAFPLSLTNPQLHRWTAGGTVGGPVKKDKLFFFLGYQFTYDSDESTGLTQMTVPSGLTNDRSVAGLQAAAESWSGSPFTKSIDPIAYDLMNAKLPDGSFLIPSNQVPGQAYAFGVPNVTLIGTSVFDAHEADAGMDYQVNSKDRLSGKYYYQNDPVTRPYGVSQTGGFPVTQENGAQVGAIDNTILIGSNLNWEQRVGYARQYSYTYNVQTLGADATPGSPYNGQPNYGIGTGEYGVNNSVLPGLL